MRYNTVKGCSDYCCTTGTSFNVQYGTVHSTVQLLYSSSAKLRSSED